MLCYLVILIHNYFNINFPYDNIICIFLYLFNSGNLPPEARREQARLFNSPDSGYDVLVASDAVGMGLNLSIRRIIFTTLTKYDGRKRRKITTSV